MRGSPGCADMPGAPACMMTVMGIKARISRWLAWFDAMVDNLDVYAPHSNVSAQKASPERMIE